MPPRPTLLAEIALAAEEDTSPAGQRWRAWIELAYGSLDGQRAVHGAALSRDLGSPQTLDTSSLLIAVHCRAGLAANTLAAALRAGTEPPTGADWRSAVTEPDADLPHDYLLPYLAPATLAALSGFCAAAATDCLRARAAGAPSDALLALYLSPMPNNALHALGEHYTPPWLADHLLAQLGWTPEQSLIDPFAGGGSLLCAALRRARALGADPLAALPRLVGLEWNPTACALARASMLLELGPALAPAAAAPDIRHADALAPALGAPSPAQPADALVTNPPWVGWEHQSRALRERVQPAWERYDLAHRGKHRTFLKEDLSTVCTIAALDAYLREGGDAGVLLPAASLSSSLASTGLRRLQIHPKRGPLALRHIDLFRVLRVFPTAETQAMAWVLRKGERTAFPVRGQAWSPRRGGWSPPLDASLTEVQQATERRPIAARPATQDPGARWMLGSADLVQASDALRGAMPYRPRSGVFTGGANAVFYLEREAPGEREAGALVNDASPRTDATPGVSRYRNVLGRAKRAAPQVTAPLEDALVHEIVRGRDVRTWATCGRALLLCPHTAETRMNAIPPAEMAERYPHALAYLKRMRPVLEARKGFARWEESFRERAHYVMQRIGAYTFAPHKVAWRYIASDFVVTALGPDERGEAVLCNDKVVSIAVESQDEAHYLAGFLCASPVRWQVLAQTSVRQISTTAVANLAVPRFDPTDPLHRAITEASAAGHAARADDPTAPITEHLHAVEEAVCDVLGLPVATLAAFREATPDIV